MLHVIISKIRDTGEWDNSVSACVDIQPCSLCTWRPCRGLHWPGPLLTLSWSRPARPGGDCETGRQLNQYQTHNCYPIQPSPASPASTAVTTCSYSIAWLIFSIHDKTSGPTIPCINRDKSNNASNLHLIFRIHNLGSWDEMSLRWLLDIWRENLDSEPSSERNNI